MKRLGKYTIETENSPSILSYAAVAGRKESEGPLGKEFDKVFYDGYLGLDTWEQAESKLQVEAVERALKKADLTADDMNFVLAGDLLNQCVSSSFAMRSLNIPYLGIYGACSTMAQGLLLSSVLIDSNAAEKGAVVTSSHFCTAERQYRFPLEYGGQRTPTAQWTVTGSGGVVVGKPRSNQGRVRIEGGTIGRILDMGITDANNMGAAMAPSAAQTIIDFFNDTKTLPADFDAIFTGDLGYVGSNLLYEILAKEGLVIKNKHKDCGLMIFDREKQDVHAGGSGCGCCASVLCSHILKSMEEGKYKNVLFIATGALLSPTTTQQGESIPGVSHLVHLRCF